MTAKEDSLNLGTLPLTVLKLSLTQNMLDKSLKLKLVTFEFRPENALDFYIFFKMDLLIIFRKLRL